MNTKISSNKNGIFIFMLCLLFTTFSINSHAHQHSHGYGPGRYYDGHRNGPVFGWGGPNVIINVPTAPYYVEPPPICRTVEVCDPYNQCWLERHCA